MISVICLSFLLSVSGTTEKKLSANSTELDIMIELTNQKNLFTFNGDVVLDTVSGSLLHFRHHCGIAHFSYCLQSIFTTLSKMTDANKVMNPQHFGSNPADIQIRNLD